MLYDYEGNQVQVVSVDTTLSKSGEPSDSKTVGDHIFYAYSYNLYAERSINSLLLSFNAGTYAAGQSLYGFYVPVDPAKGTTITVSRLNKGKRFRVAASANIPAVGVSYHDRADNDTGDTIVYSNIQSTDRYLYIAYYSTEQDTKTEAELLQGMTIFYGTEYTPKESQISALNYAKDVYWVNGSVNSSGVFTSDSKHILSDYVRVNGTYGVSCPDDYIIDAVCYDFDGKYCGAVSGITDKVSYNNHRGYLRFCIGASDESEITPSTVDFSQIKLPFNRYSALEYTNKQSFVLDAENCKCSDVYDYIDSVASAHGLYVTKNLLCNETSGLPIYYYTLGSGAKKVCIVSGQHGPGSSGDPRDSVITVAKLVHDLINGDFPHGSFLQKLHDDYTILVIPILNAYGFDNGSRDDANGDDTNRDWVDGNTIEVSAAKAVISAFDPSIAFDVHCNGTTPLVNADIEIQFGLGTTHNTLYQSEVQDYFKSYYNSDTAYRTSNITTTLQYYIQTTLGILGGLLELRWWLKNKKWLHDYQVESLNYAMLVNIIKYCASINDQESFVFEHTPNQNQY